MSPYAYLPMLTHLVCHHTLTYQSHGTIAAFKDDRWHNVSVSVGTGGSLVASVNGTKVARVEGSCKTRGMVGVGCSKYIGCSFDAIRINGAS